jgi:hypothetical protein
VLRLLCGHVAQRGGCVAHAHPCNTYIQQEPLKTSIRKWYKVDDQKECAGFSCGNGAQREGQPAVRTAVTRVIHRINSFIHRYPRHKPQPRASVFKTINSFINLKQINSLINILLVF